MSTNDINFFLQENKESTKKVDSEEEKDDVQPKQIRPKTLEDYEVEGWPKSKSFAANDYLRFHENTSLIVPVFPGKIFHPQ